MIVDRRTELKNCTFIKSFLMLCVILGHSCAFWTGTWFTKDPIIPSKMLSLLSQWIGSFHIYGFTLVSGYIYYYQRYERSNYSKFIPFIARKAKRLLVPYLFVAIIWVIPISTRFLPSQYGNLSMIISKLLSGIAQLWFLLMLFSVFLIVYYLSDILVKHTVLGTILCLVFYVGGGIAGRILPNLFQVWTACMYLIFFGTGMKMRQFRSKWLHRIPAWAWLATDIILFVIWRMLDGQKILWMKVLCFGLELIVHWVGAVMSFILLQAVAMHVPPILGRIINKVSIYSMPIYLFHQQFIYLTISLLNGKVNPYLHAAVNFAIALFGSLMVSCLIMRFPSMRILLGERDHSKTKSLSA